MDKIILRFDLNNSQKDFSMLMRVIQAVETDENAIDYKRIIKEMSLCYYWLREKRNIQCRNREIVQNIESNLQNLTENQKNEWVNHPLTELEDMVARKKHYNIGYYVRVKSQSEEDIKNIQYLVLILQQFPIVCEKIQVFLEPFENYISSNKTAWASNAAYYRYSHYMRFILNRYQNIFYSAYFHTSQKQVNIVQLSSKKKGVQSTFFPLLEVDNKIHVAFARYCMLDIQGKLADSEVMDGNPELKDLFEIDRHILDSRIKKELREKQDRNKCWERLCQILAEGRVTSLEYAIFSVLVLLSVELTLDEIRGYLERARKISNGLIQIIENIVLHSTNHKGVFTFRIIRNGSQYLNVVLEDVRTDQSDRVLEIDIADANIYETILDNFRSKLKDEDIYLKNVKLSIAHFFKDINKEDAEVKNAWEKYRTRNPVKCLGLGRLGTELRLSKAILQVRSNTTYSGEDKHLSYKENSYNSSQFRNDKAGEFIPGTQFMITLPISKREEQKGRQHNANIPLNGLGFLRESNASYAQFVDYSSENFISHRQERFREQGESKGEIGIAELDCLFYEECQRASIGNPKDLMVDMWRSELNSWESRLEKDMKVYYFDLRGNGALKSPWGLEVFCKGIVDSGILRSSKIKYIAVINCNDEFIPMMLGTMVKSKIYMGEGVQFYLHTENGLDDIILSGVDYESVILNARQYSYAKGRQSAFLQHYCKQLGEQCLDGNAKLVELFPFDVILSEAKNGITLFEQYIQKVAQKSLMAVDEAGYLISNAHMRLGNKVHLKEFYEISILFRKPRVARKLALLIVRRMKEEGVNLDSDLLFYGYASYSRALLTSLCEIVRNCQGSKHFVEFAVYQNDIMVQKTLTHISPRVRMYYSNEVPYDRDINIVQIVPISSTLTTFKKMWDVFSGSCYCKSKLIKNYTLFWVRDIQVGQKNKPTEIEKEYWTEIKDHRSIETSLIEPFPQFFCCKEVKWCNPLCCKQCYPPNLLDEIALVETDVTSTVPSQQLEVKMPFPLRQGGDENEIANEIRLINLKGCIYYGHVSRDGNHYQYYIDTIQYFHKQKKYIAKWLKKLQGKGKDRTGSITFNIIITPQHPTNVEFGNYVNDYYFDGSADIVTIDPTKEYRSNIIAKYADVRAAIEAAQASGMQVKFIYVDDTITTGVTYRRMNSLLHSLVPQTIRKSIQFSQVFVLINRLSHYSKMDYVENVEEGFHAFANLDISSIRNFGDSCAMCTLQKNSELFFKRSATTEISRYWNIKKYEYKTVAFDKYTQQDGHEELQEKGYLRMLCSHYARIQMDISEELGSDILNIIKLFTKLKEMPDLSLDDEFTEELQDHIEYFRSKDWSPIYCCVFKKNVQATVKAFLKILCRPFFSYGKNCRQAIMDLFLVLAESFLHPDFDEKLWSQEKISDSKEYLNDSKLKKELLMLCRFLKGLFPPEKEMRFIQKYLLEGLTDLRSNYIIRLDTMNYFKRLATKLEDADKESAYRKYARMVHRLINSSADETKSLWLEYLLITGKENDSNMNGISSVEIRKKDVDKDFKDFKDFDLFWYSLLIENTRLYYDSMLNFVKKAQGYQYPEEDESKRIEEAVAFMWDDYYIKNMRRFICLEVLADHGEDIEKMTRERAEKTAGLLYCLKNERSQGLERYDKMKQHIQRLLYEGDQLQILTSTFEGTKGGGELCEVTAKDTGKVTSEVVRRVKKAAQEDLMKNKSFYVGNDYIVLCIDNNEKYLKEKHIRDKTLTNIMPLYFYIECNTEDCFRVVMRVRKILMYRYQILRWMEADFNNNTMPILVQKTGINRQLLREQAGDHNSKPDIVGTVMLLQSEYDPMYREFYQLLLLKTYVNMRIARLFRSEWGVSDDNDTDRREKVYTKNKNEDSVNKALVNLGEAIFGEIFEGTCEEIFGKSQSLSPKQYFELVADYFQFDLDILGHHEEDVKMEEMEEVFNNFQGRCEDEYYYKQEYVFCIIFDILFSAVKVCRNWEIDLKRYFRDLEKQKIQISKIITLNDLVGQYYILKNEADKCRINISVEPIPEKKVAYMVFRNIVATKKKRETLEKDNEKLKHEIEIGKTEGMSIQAMKWYTETIGGEDGVKADFRYEWNEKTKRVEFVTKLPILKWEV